MCLVGWNFQPRPRPLEHREGLGFELITNGQQFHESCLCNKDATETQKERVWRTPRLENTWKFGESGVLRENTWEPCPPSPRHFSIWLFLSYNLLQRTGNLVSSASLSSVGCSSKLIEPEEEVIGTSNLYPIGQKQGWYTGLPTGV